MTGPHWKTLCYLRPLALGEIQRLLRTIDPSVVVDNGVHDDVVVHCDPVHREAIGAALEYALSPPDEEE